MDLREGKNNLLVLSVIAEYQSSEKVNLPQHKDITEKSPLTKGAVSNNCKKLEENRLITRDNEGRYKINEKEIISQYQEFLEPYFIREIPKGLFKNEIIKVNKIKTDLSDRIQDFFDTNGHYIFYLILSVLIKGRRRKFNNLREVFYYVNQVLASYGELLSTLNANKSDEILDLMKLSVCLRINYQDLEVLSTSISKKELELKDKISKSDTTNPVIKTIKRWENE